MYLKPYSPQPQYTVLEAAAFWHKQDPNQYQISVQGVVTRKDGGRLTEDDELVNEVFIRLRDAIKDKRLYADESWKHHRTASTDTALIDWNRTTILRTDLIKFADRGGERPEFLRSDEKEPLTGNAKNRRLKLLRKFKERLYEGGRLNGEDWAINNRAPPFTREEFLFVFHSRHPGLAKITVGTFARNYRSDLRIEFSKGSRGGRVQEINRLLDSI